MSKLPKTADGVYLHNLTELPWGENPSIQGTLRQVDSLDPTPTGWRSFMGDGWDAYHLPLCKLYSTREAAETHCASETVKEE